MPIRIHERDIRGKTKTGWLDSWHTFSFGQFRDPQRMGFRALRVINEDIVIPAAGFPTHPHDNMEIITYIMNGALEHKDSMGTGSVIRPGEIQKMSAGTGITHSEFNHSKTDPVHLLQIWIVPDRRGIQPAYEQITIDKSRAANDFVVVGDAQGGDGKITIHQDVKMLVAQPTVGQKLSYNFGPGRHGFLQVARGEVDLGGEVLKQGDGLQVSDVDSLSLSAQADSELILFDLA